MSVSLRSSFANPFRLQTGHSHKSQSAGTAEQKSGSPGQARNPAHPPQTKPSDSYRVATRPGLFMPATALSVWGPIKLNVVPTPKQFSQLSYKNQKYWFQRANPKQRETFLKAVLPRKATYLVNSLPHKEALATLKALPKDLRFQILSRMKPKKAAKLCKELSLPGDEMAKIYQSLSAGDAGRFRDQLGPDDLGRLAKGLPLGGRMELLIHARGDDERMRGIGTALSGDELVEVLNVMRDPRINQRMSDVLPLDKANQIAMEVKT